MSLKRTIIHIIAIALIFITTSCNSESPRLIILHSNDTHSNIDPDKETGTGGALRRKVLIDSVRSSEPNVLLVDAGDVVQGSLYYTFFKGEVETMIMNNLGYEVAILGNHEFDNGITLLTNQYRNLKAEKISTNYDMKNTPLDSLFVPYTIKEYAGKRIGIIAINIDPVGLISPHKCEGVNYLDQISIANQSASDLKNKHNADYIIALTHIGYQGDSILARNSHDIDIIIGGHSHTVIDPQISDQSTFNISNLDGEKVLVGQTGSNGHYLGEISLDLNTGERASRLIPVTDRLDREIDTDLAEKLLPYKHVVDSFMSIEATHSEIKLNKSGEPIINFVSDFIHERGSQLTKQKIDIAMMNRGGIRNSLPQGMISKGDLMMTFPFDNYITVIEIKGEDIIEALSIIAGTNKLSISSKSTLDFSPEKTYRLATIDYIAGGGDGMTPLTRGTIIAKSEHDLKDDLIEYFNSPENKDIIINPDTLNRVLPITNLYND